MAILNRDTWERARRDLERYNKQLDAAQPTPGPLTVSDTGPDLDNRICLQNASGTIVARVGTEGRAFATAAADAALFAHASVLATACHAAVARLRIVAEAANKRAAAAGVHERITPDGAIDTEIADIIERQLWAYKLMAMGMRPADYLHPNSVMDPPTDMVDGEQTK